MIDLEKIPYIKYIIVGGISGGSTGVRNHHSQFCSDTQDPFRKSF